VNGKTEVTFNIVKSCIHLHFCICLHFIAFNVGLINRNELYLFINGNEVKMNTALHQVGYEQC
jgi:hypothetical protein